MGKSVGTRFGFRISGDRFWFSHEMTVIDRLNEIIVAPATRTIRGLTTEVVLTVDDGMPGACALNFDHVSLAQRNRMGPVLCSLLERRWVEVRRALRLIVQGRDQRINDASSRKHDGANLGCQSRIVLARKAWFESTA